jgi:hypothetical protein
VDELSDLDYLPFGEVADTPVIERSNPLFTSSDLNETLWLSFIQDPWDDFACRATISDDHDLYPVEIRIPPFCGMEDLSAEALQNRKIIQTVRNIENTHCGDHEARLHFVGLVVNEIME